MMSADVTRYLPDDIARCRGVGNDEDGWRTGCERCLRRTAPVTGEGVRYMEPPPVILFFCDYLIEDEQ